METGERGPSDQSEQRNRQKPPEAGVYYHSNDLDYAVELLNDERLFASRIYDAVCKR